MFAYYVRFRRCDPWTRASQQRYLLTLVTMEREPKTAEGWGLLRVQLKAEHAA